MLVAVNASWKLPIAYFSIKSLSGEERANIIRETLLRLDEINVKVISVTCDGPSVHFRMLQCLGCNIEDVNNMKTYFLHPNKKYVFVHLDACHMIKLVRNKWATLGAFHDPDGNLVDFSYVKKIYVLQEKEGLKAGNKLFKKHMEWHTQKMKVNIAAQTGSEANVKFILLIDSVFDILTQETRTQNILKLQ